MSVKITCEEEKRSEFESGAYVAKTSGKKEKKNWPRRRKDENEGEGRRKDGKRRARRRRKGHLRE